MRLPRQYCNKKTNLNLGRDIFYLSSWCLCSKNSCEYQIPEINDADWRLPTIKPRLLLVCVCVCLWRSKNHFYYYIRLWDPVTVPFNELFNSQKLTQQLMHVKSTEAGPHYFAWGKMYFWAPFDLWPLACSTWSSTLLPLWPHWSGTNHLLYV